MSNTRSKPALIADTAIGIDPLGFAETHLSSAARAALTELQGVLDIEVRPLLAEAWETATMPPAILQAIAPLNVMRPAGITAEESDSSLYSGFRNYVLARTDVSVATLVNAQSGLFRTTVLLGGSPEQAEQLDPKIRDFSLAGVFALTEPEHGSDIAGGLSTTARRTGGEWVIDGTKRWIGGAVSADVIAVFARDIEDKQVKAFLVPRQAAGVTLNTIGGKIALRPMQNSTITLSGVRVPESARLQKINSWRDVARILGAMRSDVAWIATGLQAGALDAALTYTRGREQFGHSIGGFQLVQEKLARMLGNLTASLGLVTQLSVRQDRGIRRDENSSLAKMWTALHARETVALGREIAGGNGILLSHDSARFFADAEAVYSYEGTHEVTSLIVGRALTGVSAFLPSTNY
ncbi:Glutaryl-CoA dehydrogenase [Leucobacter sp. 7(1)]|uniref:acyl-CoA dehydrogenase family protein n=1 Tax=Leucobacter sp. 7(1) TaxID=1255613 RepID=UPI00097F3223|nr:acyl-CoA dehydrogenase family protein [Leucobacter sp. 7(1)]SJN11750.1 Glutaryl-CoA dehydrogenase [Leucobacter sp. 7(1)]